jgi:hypothetical protein
MVKPKKRFIQRAKEKNGADLPHSVNGTRILKRLEDETLRLYQQKIDEWNRKLVRYFAGRVELSREPAQRCHARWTITRVSQRHYSFTM